MLKRVEQVREMDSGGLPCKSLTTTGAFCPATVSSLPHSTFISLVAAETCRPSMRSSIYSVSLSLGHPLNPPRRCGTPWPCAPDRRSVFHNRPSLRLGGAEAGALVAGMSPCKTAEEHLRGSPPVAPRCAWPLHGKGQGRL